jgi:hypothetical protein
MWVCDPGEVTPTGRPFRSASDLISPLYLLATTRPMTGSRTCECTASRSFFCTLALMA